MLDDIKALYRIEPHAYLTRLFNELPKAKTIEVIAPLLPWNAKDVITTPA